VVVRIAILTVMMTSKTHNQNQNQEGIEIKKGREAKMVSKNHDQMRLVS
jgi:hypothetical protein